MSVSSPDLSYDGLDIMYNSITLTFQSLIFGVYTVLIPFSVHILIRKGPRSKSNVFFLCAIFVPYTVSAAFWVVSLVEQVVRAKTFFVNRAERNSSSVLSYATLFNALILVNYLFADSVVVWRAYALCKAEYSKVLTIPIIFLVLTILFIFSTIGIRIGTFFTAAGPGASSSHPIIHVLDIFQVGTLLWSLVTNLSATIIISHKAWRHRQAIRDGLRNARNRSTQAERVLALLIESGIIYFLSLVILLVFMFIRLPYGTLGDIYTPVNLQIAGMYPTLIIVLVGLHQTMRETTFWHASESTAGSSFARNTVSDIRFATRLSLQSPRTRSEIAADEIELPTMDTKRSDSEHSKS